MRLRRRHALTPDDTKAREALDLYYEEYVGNRGSLPRMAVGMMKTLFGWPVRNPDGGLTLACFSSPDEANSAISACDRKYRSKCHA